MTDVLIDLDSSSSSSSNMLHLLQSFGGAKKGILACTQAVPSTLLCQAVAAHLNSGVLCRNTAAAAIAASTCVIISTPSV